MTRKEELIKCFSKSGKEKKSIAVKLIDEMIFLEKQLSDLRKLPMIKIHPQHPELIKPTPASKLYKEFLQQYNNTVKNLCSMLKQDESSEESPLRIYLEKLNRE